MTLITSDADPLATEEIVNRARAIISEGPICDHCLGRQFARIATGRSNEQRGQALKALLEVRGAGISTGTCWVCNGLFETVDEWAAKAADALRDYEFSTFLVGTKVSGLLSENEELLWELTGAESAEPLKAELNREVGKILERRLGKTVEFTRPELVVVLNLWTETVEVQSNAVYLYGRYRKFERGIPQTRWFCRACRGMGCARCNFTGRMYPESVEELISGSLLPLFQGTDMVLHGSGREDIDARMVGSGRPVVLEIKEPHRRFVNLREAATKVNYENAGKIEVLELQYVQKEAVAQVKSAKAEKTYRAVISFETAEKPPAEEHLRAALAALNDIEIEQRTPRRVAHRRADLVRRRRVTCARLVSFDEGAQRAVIAVTCDAGLYVKELISGDEGRTTPNLSALLGMPAAVTELDVLDVELDFQIA
ncbi:MAG TPA: tRNA pseudouridine(54/55) synthase Pus10, partial [Methanomicrobia archaeon]|nr:tRNA pseudouridine(54/55) synthase Pus10 [Methanomicrobia archaeon]